MPVPVPTVIASGFANLAGCAYRVSSDQLYVADSGNGTIGGVTTHTHVTTVLGAGYNAPHDIALSVDGLHAYVAEPPGNLLRLNLTNMNRAAATVISTGLNGIAQIALDEVHGFAYVAEFTGGNIQRINLAGGARTAVASVFAPRGVLVTDDSRFLYVSSDDGDIRRFDLATNTSVVVASGLTAPRYLRFADAGESAILFPTVDGSVHLLDLTATPPLVRTIAGPAPSNPVSVAVLSSNQLLVASFNAVSEVDLTASVYSAAGPVLLGIGFVPADAAHLPGGYADTTADPSYFYQVKDCPFGGTLPLMINWENARSLGANFYEVFIHGPIGPEIKITQPFTDYLWSVPLNAFEAHATSATAGGFYQLRQSGQIWLNYWLGLLLDTTGRPNGLNTIRVKLFAAASAASEIGSYNDPGRSAALMIDNSGPVAILKQIDQQPGNVPINVCGIVNTGAPTFTFEITATAPQSHLLGWSLVAYWGDNQSETIASDSYAAHVSPTRLWAGLPDNVVPPVATPWNSTVAGDLTSTHCAHSFFVYAWDRVINGWGYVHGAASYQKSITIML